MPCAKSLVKAERNPTLLDHYLDMFGREVDGSRRTKQKKFQNLRSSTGKHRHLRRILRMSDTERNRWRELSDDQYAQSLRGSPNVNTFLNMFDTALNRAASKSDWVSWLVSDNDDAARTTLGFLNTCFANIPASKHKR